MNQSNIPNPQEDKKEVETTTSQDAQSAPETQDSEAPKQWPELLVEGTNKEGIEIFEGKYEESEDKIGFCKHVLTFNALKAGIKKHIEKALDKLEAPEDEEKKYVINANNGKASSVLIKGKLKKIPAEFIANEETKKVFENNGMYTIKEVK